MGYANQPRLLSSSAALVSVEGRSSFSTSIGWLIDTASPVACVVFSAVDGSEVAESVVASLSRHALVQELHALFIAPDQREAFVWSLQRPYFFCS